MSDSHQPPSNLDDVDREIRIEKIKRELNEIAGGEMITGGSDSISLEMEEAFLDHVLAYERAECDTNFNRLLRRGLGLPPAAELDDATLTVKLAEIIHELSELRWFLYDTDHLSDRELYHWLWSVGLRDESPDLSGMPDGVWHTSPIGGGSDEDTGIWLKYYADEEERHRWHLNFPKDPIPDHEQPPFDRDRHLPKR